MVVMKRISRRALALLLAADALGCDDGPLDESKTVDGLSGDERRQLCAETRATFSAPDVVQANCTLNTRTASGAACEAERAQCLAQPTAPINCQPPGGCGISVKEFRGCAQMLADRYRRSGAIACPQQGDYRAQRGINPGANINDPADDPCYPLQERCPKLLGP